MKTALTRPVQDASVRWAVQEASGRSNPGEALALINQTLDEALAEQEGDFDADSRRALAWFEHTRFAEGEQPHKTTETANRPNQSLESANARDSAGRSLRKRFSLNARVSGT